MIDTKKINRRQFLKLSGATSAGLLLAIHSTPSFASSSVTNFKPSAFFQIDESGLVRMWMSETEMGQGVRTSLPMLIAEELEVGWQQVKVINADNLPEFGSMLTGGSASVRGRWKEFRLAGAKAREMLIAAAAKIWQVSAEQCFAHQGKIINKVTKEKLAYKSLVSLAAKMPEPKEPPLKQSNFSLIGKDMPSTDNSDIVRGKANYGIDTKIEGMLYASIERAPQTGAILEKFSAELALAMPGVVSAHTIDGSSFPQLDYYRSSVAILATNSWSAQNAREKLTTHWKDAHNPTLNSEQIFTKFSEQNKLQGFQVRNEGDIFLAAKNADEHIEVEYQLPFLAHAPMEPMNTVAKVTKNSCEIWTPTQRQTRMQDAIAKLLNIPKENILIHTTLLGGGFGRRLEVDYAIEAAILSSKVKRPVQVLWTREDDIQMSSYRSASLHKVTSYFKSGQLMGMKHRYSALSVFAQQEPQWLSNGVDFAILLAGKAIPYQIPNFSIEQHQHDIPVPVNWWRGTFSNHHVFVQESWIDEVANHIKQDPIQYRLDLLGEDRIFTVADAPGWGELKTDIGRLKQVLTTVAKMAKWSNKLAANKGQGIALYMHDLAKSYVGVIMDVSVANNIINIDKVFCAVDCGVVVNPQGVKAQIEGGLIYGLSATIDAEITFSQGKTEQSNFHDYPSLRMSQCPDFEIELLENGDRPLGIGEALTSAAAPALTNAIFAATGKRLRKLPISLN